MKTFNDEWILEPFVEHPTFFSGSMFGGLAVYLFERQMLLLVEPTKSGRWKWHGDLVCTDYEHHESIQAEFPPLKPNNDPRFGILPKGPKPRGGKHAQERG